MESVCVDLGAFGRGDGIGGADVGDLAVVDKNDAVGFVDVGEVIADEVGVVGEGEVSAADCEHDVLPNGNRRAWYFRG